MSQNKEILSFLKRGQKLTRLEALKYFGCLNLPGRIFELRIDNNVTDEWYNTASGKRVKRYFISDN